MDYSELLKDAVDMERLRGLITAANARLRVLLDAEKEQCWHVNIDDIRRVYTTRDKRMAYYFVKRVIEHRLDNKLDLPDEIEIVEDYEISEKISELIQSNETVKFK